MTEKCAFCGTEVLMSFQCSRCNKHYCVTHQLPEVHQCTGVEKIPPLATTLQRSYLPNCPKCDSARTKITAVKPEFDVFRCPDCNHKWSQTGKTHWEQPKEHPQKSQPKRRKQKKKIGGTSLLAIVLVISIMGNIYVWNYRYQIGTNYGRNEGYTLGVEEGYETGYNKGYNEGAIDVSETDYKEGYALGAEEGYENGYNSGYFEGLRDGNATGYDVGFTRGMRTRGYSIRDPTYPEAIQFMESDNTDKNVYNETTYTCHDFTADFKNNAFESGLRCGYVYVEFSDSAHAVIAFNTTDQGVFFVEPQDDEKVDVIVGQPYFNRTRYEINFDDTIVRYKIVW